MGACVFCGKSAGMFAVVHNRCRERRAAFAERMASTIEPFLSGSISVEVFARLLDTTAEMSLIQRHEIPGLLPDWVDMALGEIAKKRPPKAKERARGWIVMAHYALKASNQPAWVSRWGHLDIVSATKPKSSAVA